MSRLFFTSGKFVCALLFLRSYLVFPLLCLHFAFMLAVIFFSGGIQHTISHVQGMLSVSLLPFDLHLLLSFLLLQIHLLLALSLSCLVVKLPAMGIQR